MRLWILILLLLASCTHDKEACKNDLDNCHLVNENTLAQYESACGKLAKCMKADYTLLHFQSQSRNPYACSIKLHNTRTNKYPAKGRFFYPKARISFGEMELDYLEEAVATCELMTETGEYSDDTIDAQIKSYKAFQARRAKERAEAAKFNAEQKSRNHALKIQEYK